MQRRKQSVPPSGLAPLPAVFFVIGPSVPPLGDDLHQIFFLSRERAFEGTVRSALLA